ncbi:MAG TPA: patatin-like phospholipase family protein [Bryobacteraceae bacterium]|nr:patatin-like phospholipase family protein [Bryobacteraceae bacterium]
MHPNSEAKCFECVAQEELDDISARRQARGQRSISPNEDVEIRAHDAELLGVCISGGGIRSATFALGVLQGLVAKSILEKADYLSTVSGGGYIGSWLQGVLDRSGSFAALDPALKEHASLRFLRKYSNYLAPRPGLSIDSAVIPVIWFRNAGLNQAIIIAATFAVLLLCHVPGYLLYPGNPEFAWAAYAAAFLMTVIAVVVMAGNLKDVVRSEFATRVTYRDKSDPPDHVAYGVIVPMLLTAPALAVGMFQSFTAWWWLLLLSALIVLHTVLQWRGGFPECFRGSHKGVLHWLRTWLHIGWMSIVCSALDCGSICATGLLIQHWSGQGIQGAYQTIAWGPPLILFSFFAGVGLQIGLMGKDYPDAAREWLARAGAWLAVCALGWAAVFTVAIFSPYWVMLLWAWKGAVAISAAGAWLTSTLGGVLAGKSSSTGKAREDGGGGGMLDRIARYAPLVALPGFFIAIAYAVHAAVFATYLFQHGLANFDWNCFVNEMLPAYWLVLTFEHPWLPVAMLALAVAIFVVLSLRVNINEFSMHHFYKNRLVRCYLGASVADRRKPNRFTGFDPKDDIRLACLSTKHKERRAPYPILNATLTVTQGSELATQERKAKSWIFTPLYSGFTPEGTAADRAAMDQLSMAGYVPTKDLLGGQLHIGTAMAISGAALSPGQGFHTSTQVAFLMTLFDVRLGWWIGNPRSAEKFGRPGPRIALWPLIRELFGAMDERSPYLNLSDGGNFDNLGLYELVRRRCRFIVAVDGEEDQKFEFNALGAAVRKCRTDFHVEIDINPCAIRPAGDFSKAHCAVGTIRYPDTDKPGYLLYIKASMTGDEPADVELYRRQCPVFPQQSTADQFFTESQFESYRRLGLHCVDSVVDFAPDRHLASVFERLADRWEVPPGPPDGESSQQAEAYSRLLEEWRDAQDIDNFDSDLVENRPSEFGAGAARTRYFLILDLIQLMENVFVSCQLGNSQNRDHRANSGWIRIFRYWLRQPAVCKVWESQHENYTRSFRHFVHDLIHEDKTKSL